MTIQERPQIGAPVWPPEINEHTWAEATREDLRQYLQLTVQIAGEYRNQAETTNHENQHLRQQQARIESLFGIDLDELLQDNATPRTVPFAAFERERHLRIQDGQRRSQEQQQQDKLFSNRFLKPAQKIGLHYLKRAVERGTTHDTAGRTRINATTLSSQMGMSAETGDRLIDFCRTQLPTLVDIDSHEDALPGGRTGTRNYIKFDEALLSNPEQIRPLEFKKQGGDRYSCQRCGSPNVVIIRRLHCEDCHHEIDLEPTRPNGKYKKRSNSGRSNLLLTTPDGSQDQSSQNNEDTSEAIQEPQDRDDNEENEQNRQKQLAFEPSNNQTAPSLSETPLILPESNLQDTLKPVTPPQAAPLVISAEEKAAAIDLYLDLAGSDPVHLEMIPNPQKYTTVASAPSADDIRAHLNGDKTIGTRLYHPDQTTRAYVVDADNEQDLERLWEGARKLGMAGYLPLIDCPPDGRPQSEGYHEVSAHAWIVKEEREDKAAGWAEILRIAPEWAELRERWPALAERAAGNRVRLPGGKYIMPEYSQWTTLYSAVTGEAATSGITQAHLLLVNQTPALVLPPPTPCDPMPAPPAAPSKLHHQIDPAATAATIVDHVHQAKYARHGFVVAFPPGYLAERFNVEHSVTEFVQPGENKKYFSPNGNERTASAAAFVQDGKELLTDLSNHGLRSDGTHQTYDALELYCQVNSISKDEMLRRLGRETAAQAKRDIAEAAREGKPIPAEIERILTPKGREYYAQIASQAGRGKQVVAVNERCATCQISIDQADDFYIIDEQIGYCSLHGPHAAAVVTPVTSTEQSVPEETQGVADHRVIEVFGMQVEVPEGLRPIRPHTACPFCKVQHTWSWHAEQDRWICARCKR